MKRTLILACALAAGAFSLSPLVRADEARLALAREVIELSQMNKMFDAMVPQIQQMSMQMVQGQLASMTPEQRADFEAFQKEAVTLAMDSAKGMLAKVDQLYADVYTVDELTAMKSFFGSTAGQSMIAKQPQLAQRMMPLMQAMQAELMPKIQALTQAFQQKLQAAKAGGATVGLPDPNAIAR